MTSSSSPRRFPWRRRILLAGWLAAGLVIVGRAASVQILQGAYWSQKALDQHQDARTIRSLAEGAGMFSLWDHAWRLLREGLTSLDEVRRVLLVAPPGEL